MRRTDDRSRAGGIAALRDGSSGPHTSPRATSAEVVGKVLYLRPKEALSAGQYVISAARDGADGGEDYFYFTVP